MRAAMAPGECYEPSAAASGLAGLPRQSRRNAAVCDGRGGTWHTPAFLLLGFPKAGSSELWHQLHRHPLVRRRTKLSKETHTFDHLPMSLAVGAPPTDAAWANETFERKPTARFRALLPANLKAREICGDGTPWYAAYLDAPRIIARVQRWAPAARLLVILRSPVRAMWSCHCMNSRYSVADAALDAGVRFDEEAWRLPLPPSRASCPSDSERTQRARPISSWDGLGAPRELLWAYAVKLRAWRAGFGRERFHLMRIDQLRHTWAIQHTHRFLGLPPLKYPSGELRHHENVHSGGDSGKLRCAPAQASRGAPHSEPGAEALHDMLIVYFGRAALGWRAGGSTNGDAVPMANPWPKAQVQELVADGWVDSAFIEPWVQDARLLARALERGEYKTCAPRKNASGMERALHRALHRTYD